MGAVVVVGAAKFRPEALKRVLVPKPAAGWRRFNPSACVAPEDTSADKGSCGRTYLVSGNVCCRAACVVA